MGARSNHRLKKAKERRYARRFVESLGDEYHLSNEDREQPDLALIHRQRRIGLEVSELFWPNTPPRQVGEALRARVCNQAAKLWKGQSGPSVDVMVYFDECRRFNKRDVPRISRDLVTLVRAKLPPVGSVTRHEQDWPLWDPPECQMIRVARFGELDTTCWHSAEAAYLPHLTIGVVQRRLNVKDTKLLNYSNEFPEHWLLLVMNHFRISTSWLLSHEVTAAQYRTLFHRAYLLDAHSGTSVQLRV